LSDSKIIIIQNISLMSEYNIEQYNFLGLKISIFNKISLISYLQKTVENSKKIVCFGYSLGYIPLFKKYPSLYNYCNDYDLMVTDGRFFYLLAKFLGVPIQFDISVPFFSKLIMELANENGYSIMIIGSTAEQNKKATENIRLKYPGAIIYEGYHGGVFSEADQKLTVDKINNCKPDILFIGVSSPKKEEFASKWKDRIDAKIIVPFGGVIDGLSGKVKLASPLLKKVGLAAFIRVFQEPRRLLKSRLILFYEIVFKIIPITIWHAKIKGNKNFFLPGLFGIHK
jgi:N-acetylglucosaminyldiphosphoundecaprenol N-acetyl-beta-D-mannosaminyltransferase